jgi:hypothetical protein
VGLLCVGPTGPVRAACCTPEASRSVPDYKRYRSRVPSKICGAARNERKIGALTVGAPCTAPCCKANHDNRQPNGDRWDPSFAQLFVDHTLDSGHEPAMPEFVCTWTLCVCGRSLPH